MELHLLQIALICVGLFWKSRAGAAAAAAKEHGAVTFLNHGAATLLGSRDELV